MSSEPFKHPEINDLLQIDLVRERIFWFCDVPSLKSIRLVSKKWKDLSITSWRNKAVIHLRHNSGEMSDTEVFLDLMDSEEEGESSFQLRKHPFKRYSVKLDDWNTNEETDTQLRRVALAIFNSRAHHVKISWKRSNFTGFDEFLSTLNSESLKVLEVIWETLDHDIPRAVEPFTFSNLKCLKLVSRLHLLRHTPNRSLWRFLLQSFPQLEALSVKYNPSDYGKCLVDRLEIVNLLKDIRLSSVGSLLALKEFEMIDVSTSQKVHGSEGQESNIINALAECKFPLKKLSIHAGWHGGEGGEMIPIIPLLKACKDTLKCLKASINFDGVFISEAYRTFKGTGRVKSDLDLEQLDRIYMESLKEVQLVNGLDWAMFLLAHLKLPQLEKLIVSYEKGRNSGSEMHLIPPPGSGICNLMLPLRHALGRNIGRDRDSRYPLISVWLPKEKMYASLRTFELHDNSKVVDSEMVREFGRMMPNLTHLTIPLDKTTFPVMCQHFKELRKLNILEHGRWDDMLSELDDETLIGLSKMQLEEGGMSSRKPNITDLEYLSDLRISCQTQLLRDRVKFTEHSVIYGFLQLPGLHHLSVAIKDLSDHMKEQLLNHVKVVVQIQMKGKEPYAHQLQAIDLLRKHFKVT